MTLWINGDWVTGLGERRVKTNPVSGDVLWHGNDADATQVTQACQAARAAFAGWAKQPFSARQTIVEKFALLLESNKAELTQIIAKETGKPHWEAATELTAMINKIAISVKAYHARTGANYRMARQRCAIAHMACWRFLVRITSPVIYPMVILFRHCWQAIR